LGGGSIAHFNLTAQHACCSNCSRLVSFDGAEVSYLDLQSCRNVDLSTLASVRGLVNLQIVGSGPVVTDFGFATRCRELKNLTITTVHNTADFSALGRVPALGSAFLVVRRKLLAQVAGDFPHLVLSNGDVGFRGSQEMSHFDFERERTAALGVPYLPL